MKVNKSHENYKELIWMLAKTDFKLRYQGSVLGYVWALLKPLMMFAILNFVFSSIFNFKNTGEEFYSLQLLVAIMIFNFFSEGTVAGMMSLMSKAQLVTKIYVPRWAIILASTVNATMIFLMNLVIMILFAIYYGFTPSLAALGMFILFVILTYVLILNFSFIAAPLFLRFRDLGQIWDVIISAMFYAAPIVYPLTLLPEWTHKIILLNPMAFIIHFMKSSLVFDRFPEMHQMIIFITCLLVNGVISWNAYKGMEKTIGETI